MDKHYYIVTILARLLDSEFGVGKFKFGLDPLVGLIPGIGDGITFLLSFYIVWVGYHLKLPKDKIGIMIKNVVVDFLIGLVPGIGDIADFIFHSNRKNLKIIQEHLATTGVEKQIHL